MKDLYRTRMEIESVVPRQHPVVFGSSKADVLSGQQLEFYQRNGYLILPDIFTDRECQFLLQRFQQVGAEKKKGDEFIYEPDRPDILRSLFSPQKHDTYFDMLSRDERILSRVEQLLGSEVYLKHARINVKPAIHGKAFDWHSDFETWHAEDGIPAPRMVTAWVMLTENNEYNGPLYVIPGSHHVFIGCEGATPEDNHKVSLSKQTIGVPSPKTLERLYKENGIRSVKGAAGTLVFHECNLLHASPDNVSPLARTNAMFVYNSVENLPAEKPFAAKKFRPEFLSSHDFTPLKKVCMDHLIPNQNSDTKPNK